MYTLIIFLIGVFVGTVFHMVIQKWTGKVKSVAKEFADDVNKEIKKTNSVKL